MKRRRITWASGFIMACMLVSSSFLFSSYHTKKMADDIWKILGLSRQTGTESIKNSFLNGYLYYYGARNVKNLAANDRAALAKDLLNYTKEYISGADFKNQYADLRKNARPEAPVSKPLRSLQEIQKDEIAKTEKSIKDAEKTMKEVGPEIGKGIQPVLDMFRKNLKEYQDPNHQNFAAIAMGEKYQQEDQQKRYNERMKKWENEYPENINQFIADKLQKNAGLHEEYRL